MSSDIIRRWKKEWEFFNPVLRDGEPGIEIDTSRLKAGDGRTAWTELTFVKGGAITDEVDLPAYLTQASLNAKYVPLTDARLTDQRVPTNNSVDNNKVAAGALSQTKVTNLISDLAAKASLVNGVIPTSQIPALALVEAYVVASQAAMLALSSTQVQKGDIAVRTDGAGTFILNATDPSVLANWVRLNAPTDAVVSVNGQTGTVVLSAANIGLGNVSNTSDANKPVSTAQQTALNAKADLVGGVIPSSQLPSISLVDTYVVASQAAMLALTTTQVQKGDIAVRTDGAGTFILTAADPTVLSNWVRLNAPTDVVVSVAGKTGTVTLAKADVGLGNVDNTADTDKPLSTAQANAVNRAYIDYNNNTSVITSAWDIPINSFNRSQVLRRTLGASVTATVSTPTDTTKAVSSTLILMQDSTGGRVITWSGIKWPNGQAPTLSTAPNAIDIITLVWAGEWLGFVSGVAMA